MPTLTYQYVYFAAGGSHTRQPRVINAYGGFTPIPGLNSGGAATLQTNTSFQVPAAALPASEMINGTVYNFSFVNVTGLNGGGLTSFDHNTPPPSGTVGSAPVKVLVVYLPQGGPGPNGGSGVVIDAFDETNGTLVDDTFVTVSTNGMPDAGQTTSGNVDGFVDTTQHSETITALSHILPSDAYFGKWVNLGSPAPLPAGLNLSVSQGHTIYALAFFNHPLKSFLKDFKDLKEHQKEFKEVEKFYLADHLKQAGKEKDGKEIYEGNPVDTGDPEYFVNEVSKLNQVIARVELRLDAAIKGNAFIKEGDRPEVGRHIARNAE